MGCSDQNNTVVVSSSTDNLFVVLFSQRRQLSSSCSSWTAPVFFGTLVLDFLMATGLDSVSNFSFNSLFNKLLIIYVCVFFLLLTIVQQRVKLQMRHQTPHHPKYAQECVIQRNYIYKPLTLYLALHKSFQICLARRTFTFCIFCKLVLIYISSTFLKVYQHFLLQCKHSLCTI